MLIFLLHKMIVCRAFSQLYDWFCHWPPLLIMMVQKGGQVTKPIIIVKMLCRLSIICVKGLLGLPGYEILWSLYSLITFYNAASDWPRTVLQPG